MIELPTCESQLAELLKIANDASASETHIEKLCKVRHLLLPKEQKIVDLMVKLDEIVAIVDDIRAT